CKPRAARGRGDHPRVCGEHEPDGSGGHDSPGSSPRVRGAHSLSSIKESGDRIIPACAGSTGWWIRMTMSASDHPRVCGEHEGVDVPVPAEEGSSPRVRGAQSTAQNWLHDTGSSPRVRGARLRMGDEYLAWRIIPACAGSTFLEDDIVEKKEDHPRVCGEHRGAGLLRPARPGSSPRVRGAHLMTRDYSCHHRKTDSLSVGVGPAASQAVGILFSLLPGRLWLVCVLDAPAQALRVPAWWGTDGPWLRAAAETWGSAQPRQ